VRGQPVLDKGPAWPVETTDTKLTGDPVTTGYGPPKRAADAAASGRRRSFMGADRGAARRRTAGACYGSLRSWREPDIQRKWHAELRVIYAISAEKSPLRHLFSRPFTVCYAVQPANAATRGAGAGRQTGLRSAAKRWNAAA